MLARVHFNLVYSNHIQLRAERSNVALLSHSLCPLYFRDVSFTIFNEFLAGSNNIKIQTSFSPSSHMEWSKKPIEKKSGPFLSDGEASRL